MITTSDSASKSFEIDGDYHLEIILEHSPMTPELARMLAEAACAARDKFKELRALAGRK